MKARGWAVAITIVAATIGFLGYFAFSHSDSTNEVTMNGQTFRATILRTEKELMKGLSGTVSLPNDRAMVFVFPPNSPTDIWMKDMNYPIDIIWLNSEKEIVYLVKDADPSTYNKADPSKSKNYKSDQLARYVIETASGTIEKTGIAVGDRVQLPSGI